MVIWPAHWLFTLVSAAGCGFNVAGLLSFSALTYASTVGREALQNKDHELRLSAKSMQERKLMQTRSSNSVVPAPMDNLQDNLIVLATTADGEVLHGFDKSCQGSSVACSEPTSQVTLCQVWSQCAAVGTTMFLSLIHI